MQSLATKYRPKTFEDVCSQHSVIKILEQQLITGKICNAMLFCGASGCGKTTLARIFAKKLNDGVGEPIEIDAASNSGVDNVRTIVKEAAERSVSSKYKVYILDECHSFSSTGWQAWLKCIEEPPAYTVFIFCTTDPQKIPPTILNRCLRLNITRVPAVEIKRRLEWICNQEQYINYNDACDYISRICNGGMRDGITLLEKCSSYSNDLCMDNIMLALGNYSYSTFFKLCNAVIDGDENKVLSTIEDYYINGNDMKLFVSQFMDFCLDIAKYTLFKDISVTRFPSTMINDLEYATSFDNSSKYYAYLVDKLLDLKNTIKNEVDIKSTIEVVFLRMCRCQ